MLYHSVSLLSLIISVTTADVPPASAALHAVSPDADRTTTAVQLRLFAGRSRDTRLSIVATSLLTGAAMVATGIILDGRSDDVSKSVGVGLIAGGAAPLLFSAFLLRPSAIEKVNRDFEALSGTGESPEVVQRTLDEEWMRAATKSHSQRRVAGTVEVALGGALTVAGTYLLLARAGVAGMSRNEQYQWGSFLVGPGVPIFTLGVRSLLVDSLEEISWQTHDAGSQASPRPPRISLGMLPTRGGLSTALLMPLW